jgi:hypothetical protein
MTLKGPPLLLVGPVDGGGDVKVAAESIQVGLHSLQITGERQNVLPSAVTEGGWYELSFGFVVRLKPTISFGPSTQRHQQ